MLAVYDEGRFRVTNLHRVVVLQHDRPEEVVAPIRAGGAGQDVLPEQIPLGPGPDVVALKWWNDVACPI